MMSIAWRTFAVTAVILVVFLAGSFWGPGRLRDDVLELEREVDRLQDELHSHELIWSEWRGAHLRDPPHDGSIPDVVREALTSLEARVSELER